jgi:teichoic acid transport system ATP-binding protein
MNNWAIKIDNITKIYNLYEKPIDRLKESLNLTRRSYHQEYFALDNVSLEIGKGETIGIIGTNGSGKSTLLKLITGVLTPTNGDIKVNGKISALLELGAGFNPEYTGLENIYLNGSMMGFSKEEISNKVEAVLEFAGIGEFIHQPVKTYSSGMFARLAFAVAINVEPDILIVDEALSVGDVYFQAKCYNKINQIKESGTTILIVTHDMGSVIKYCDRAVLLNKGKFIEQGNPNIIVDLYKKILVNQFEDDTDELKNDDKPDGQQDAKLEIGHENWKDKLRVNTNKLEYGDKRAEIIDFAILDHKLNITNLVYKDEDFIIKIKVKFNQEIDNPIFAYTIKDSKGTELTGTNTRIEDHDVEIAKAGQIYVISFTQKMTLQGGEYLLSLGCTGYESDEFIVYDRLYDITNVSVISHKNTVGLFDMNACISIKVE